MNQDKRRLRNQRYQVRKKQKSESMEKEIENSRSVVNALRSRVANLQDILDLLCNEKKRLLLENQALRQQLQNQFKFQGKPSLEFTHIASIENDHIASTENDHIASTENDHIANLQYYNMCGESQLPLAENYSSELMYTFNNYGEFAENCFNSFQDYLM